MVLRAKPRFSQTLTVRRLSFQSATRPRLSLRNRLVREGFPYSSTVLVIAETRGPTDLLWTPGQMPSATSFFYLFSATWQKSAREIKERKRLIQTELDFFKIKLNILKNIARYSALLETKNGFLAFWEGAGWGIFALLFRSRLKLFYRLKKLFNRLKKKPFRIFTFFISPQTMLFAWIKNPALGFSSASCVFVLTKTVW